jgi:N,N'-diacetyllegionaminate synthase
VSIEIIAEAGVSHLGRLDIARRMARAAKLAGCDIVKYQTYIPHLQYPDGSRECNEIAQWCLSQNEWMELAAFCNDLNIEFMSTPGDIPSLEFLVKYCGVKRIKIGSDDLTNRPLLIAAQKTGLPIILSTGMASMDEIHDTLDMLHPPFTGWPDITLLHCVSSYPCTPGDANLAAIKSLEKLLCPVGYSDHCPGYLACVAAAALGATIIEKHFMIHEFRDGPDREVSIFENQLRHMVNDIRQIERMLGTGVKEPCEAEKQNIPLLRKGPDGMRAL